MTESTVLQNTITYSAAIMLARGIAYGSLHLASRLSCRREQSTITYSAAIMLATRMANGAPDILAMMPDRTIHQNTITYSAAIMLARRMTNDALHSASWLR